MARVKKFIKKVAKKVRGKVIKRYFKKGYAPKMQTIMKDVAMLKGLVNVEKKRYEVNQTTTQIVGQCDVNNSGHFLVDVTPQPSQGVGYDNKTGNSFKLVGSHFDFQFSGQASNISGARLKIQFIQVPGLPYGTVSDIMGKFIQPNGFITGGTVYDINSARDQDYFRDFKVICTKYVTLAPDNITGQINFKQISMGFKKQMHIRTDNNSATLSSGQIIMLITADRGNRAQNTASTLTGVSETGTNTGVKFNYKYVHYFVDN